MVLFLGTAVIAKRITRTPSITVGLLVTAVGEFIDTGIILYSRLKG